MLTQALGQIMLCYAMLSHFSRVRLCVTPQTAAHQASPSLGFSSKNTGVGCNFLLQCMKVKRESEVAQSCPTLSDPKDCSLPGSSVHGIFQASVLEWGAIAFSIKSCKSSAKNIYIVFYRTQLLTIYHICSSTISIFYLQTLLSVYPEVYVIIQNLLRTESCKVI